MTKSDAEKLAEVLDDFDNHNETDQIAYRAAAELRRLAALEAELERERMRLTACGVVACSDTPASAAVARDMHPDYRSASCDDVARRVDECISLRAERDALRESVERTKTDAERYRWLKVNAGFGIRQNQVTELSVMLYALPNHMGELDAAIDAAMKGTQ